MKHQLQKHNQIRKHTGKADWLMQVRTHQSVAGRSHNGWRVPLTALWPQWRLAWYGQTICTLNHMAPFGYSSLLLLNSCIARAPVAKVV